MYAEGLLILMKKSLVLCVGLTNSKLTYELNICALGERYSVIYINIPELRQWNYIFQAISLLSALILLIKQDD